MPIFEYRCSKCGHVTSFLELSGPRPTHPCEKCGSEDTRKAFSTFAARVAAGSAAAPHSGGCSCCSTAKQCPYAKD